MPIHFEWMEGEPILLASLSGKVTPEMIYQLYEESARLADEAGHAYRITDVSDLDGSFGDLVLVMAKAASGQPGSPSDPRITAVLVGSEMLVRIYAEGLRQEQYGKLNVPLFANHDEALVYLREQMPV